MAITGCLATDAKRAKAENKNGGIAASVFSARTGEIEIGRPTPLTVPRFGGYRGLID
jgi:hypothetical protein